MAENGLNRVELEYGKLTLMNGIGWLAHKFGNIQHEGHKWQLAKNKTGISNGNGQIKGDECWVVLDTADCKTSI